MSTHTLVVSLTCQSTAGHHAFPVSTTAIWNNLPNFVTLSTFKQHFNSALFAQSYGEKLLLCLPKCILYFCFMLLVFINRFMQNSAKWLPTFGPSEPVWDASPTSKWHPTSPFIIITQPENQYSVYRPTELEGRRLIQPGWLVIYQNVQTHPETVTITTEWILSNPRQIHGLFQVFPTEALIFIKPPEVYRHACVYAWVNTEALFVAHLVHVNFRVIRLCLFCDYHNCHSTPQANHNFQDFSLTNVKFPDFSRFSRQMVTLF